MGVGRARCVNSVTSRSLPFKNDLSPDSFLSHRLAHLHKPMMDDYDMEDASFDVDMKTPIHPEVAPPSARDIVKNGNSVLIVTVFDDHTSTPDNVRAFLARWPPSITPVQYCNWIALDRGGHRPSTPDIAGLCTSFEALKASGNVTVSEIDRIAHAHCVLSGKWLVYADPPQVDALWARFVSMVCFRLGRGSLKVSPRQEGEVHVICVYVDNYTDEAQVGALREALREAGVVWRIGFKPDAYTHLGIYKKNPWNIRPSLYHN